MNEAFTTIAPTGGFIATLVAIAWLVYTGKLIPVRAHDREIVDKDAQITEWRTAYRAEATARDMETRQRTELLEPYMRTQDILIRALPLTPTTGGTEAQV